MNKHNVSLQLNMNVSAGQIFEQLPGQATLEQAKTFLAIRNVSFSGGSWDFMISQRLKPALESGVINLEELASFLAESEEHGKQHVLLYKLTSKYSSLLFETDHISKTCTSEPRFPKYNFRQIVGVPEKTIVAEVRNDTVDGQDAIVIKTIERRYVRDESSYHEWEDNGKLYTSVDTKPYRAANVVRIRRNGLCEVRIHSHSDSYDYEVEARALLNSLSPLLDGTQFRPYSLRNARHFVCDPLHRKTAMKIFDLKHTEHIDLEDGRLRPSISGPGSSMLNSSSLTAAMDAFQAAQGTVHRAGLHVRAGGSLRRGLNLGLSGADNEFFLTAKVTRDEYEYILKSILSAMSSMSST